MCVHPCALLCCMPRGSAVTPAVREPRESRAGVLLLSTSPASPLVSLPICSLTFHFSSARVCGFLLFQTQPLSLANPVPTGLPLLLDRGMGSPSPGCALNPPASGLGWCVETPRTGGPETGALATKPGLSPLRGTHLLLTFSRETAEA